MKQRTVALLLAVTVGLGMICAGVNFDALGIQPVAESDDCILASGTCGAKGDGTHLTWELTCEGVLTVSGTGAMADWNGIATPWENYKQQITTVILPDGITKIGLAAFKNCANLTTINIPEGVTGIESNTFNGCTNLNNIVLPQSVSFIRSYAFYNCSALTAINIPANVTIIGNHAFRNCTALTAVAIPDKVTSIGEYAFYDCSALTTLTLGNGLTEIKGQAFRNCTSLTDVTIPSSVTAIGDFAFYRCGSIASLVIDNSAAEIGKGAFYECAAMTTAVLGDRITGIGVEAFFGCTVLFSVDIPATVTALGDYAFRNCPAMTSATFRTVTPPAIGKAAFFETPCTFYVPCGSKDAYKEALNVNTERVEEKIIPFVYSVTSSDETQGTVTLTQEPVSCDDLTLAFQADAADGWQFKQWSDGNTDNPRTLTLTQDTVIIALFESVQTELPIDIILQETETNAYYDQFALDYDGLKINSATLNRQFKQGVWSTLCLPFNVSSGMMTALNMRGRVYDFRHATGNADIGVTLYFSQASSLVAGKCYIVNANAKMAARQSFVFSGVTIDLTADKVSDLTVQDAYDGLDGYNDGTGTISLVGTLRNGTLIGTVQDNTYMGLKDNAVYYPNSTIGSTIYAYRGIFRSETPANLQRVRVVVEGESVTELEIINGVLQEIPNARKYIENGALYINRNGTLYNAQGAEL